MVTQLVDTHTLEAIVAPVVEAEGLALVVAQFQREKDGAILRVLLEQPEMGTAGTAETTAHQGVSLADCTRVSRALSVVLDEHEASFPSAYSLEVSSAGIERPLVKAHDYQRFAGREAHVTTRGHGAPAERKNFSGTLVGLVGDEIVLRDPEGNDLKIALGEISKAHLVHRF